MPTQLTALTEPFPTRPPIGVPPVWACSVLEFGSDESSPAAHRVPTLRGVARRRDNPAQEALL